MTRSRILPKITMLTGAGTDPDAIDIEDCREVYADRDQDEFGKVFQPCDKSPNGQCEYDSTDWLDYDRCIHCKRITG